MFNIQSAIDALSQAEAVVSSQLLSNEDRSALLSCIKQTIPSIDIGSIRLYSDVVAGAIQRAIDNANGTASVTGPPRGAEPTDAAPGPIPTKTRARAAKGVQDPAQMAS